MDLKERIKDLCKTHNVSMNKLEKDLGFGTGYISKLGKSTPNASKIQAISDYFGVSVDYLMTGDDTEKKYYLDDDTAAIAQEIASNKELRMLFDASRDASPEHLTAFYNFIKAMSDTEKGSD